MDIYSSSFSGSVSAHKAGFHFWLAGHSEFSTWASHKVPSPQGVSSKTQDIHIVCGFKWQGTMSALTTFEWIPRPRLEDILKEATFYLYA